MAFVHLHVHSHFSLLDGAIPVERIARRVAELGQPAVALTDHVNLFGAVAFDKACRAAGVAPIIGSGMWVQPEGIAFRDPRRERCGWHLLLLVLDEAGYRNLSRLITTAIFEGNHYKPRVDWTHLAAHREGLVALTSGPRGIVRGPLLEGDEAAARAHLERLAEIFGPDHLYVELQDIGLPGDVGLNDRCRALAAEFGLSTVVTNNVHHLRPEDAPVVDLLHCIAESRALDDPDRPRLVGDQCYLKDEAEMRALFRDDGEALDRTVEIAERCTFRFTYGRYCFPSSTPPDPGRRTEANWRFFLEAFPPPVDWGIPPDAPMPDPSCGDLEGYFTWQCREGLDRRLESVEEGGRERYRERLAAELEIIVRMGFPAYFLIVAEFINWAKGQGIPVGPGRGSAAGSVAAWSLRITDIDPVRFDLLFERFLNPERVSMPDVDVDFCQDRREEVIEHTRRKYGEEVVAQIITYGKLQARQAVRDVARVCGLKYDEADRIAKLIPQELGITLDRALEEEALASLVEADERVRRVVHLARRIEGLIRQTGVHAAGVVVADRPLVDLVPLYRDGPDGGPVVQFDMKSAEAIGLIKFDFLGLKTLDLIRDAVAMVERNTGERVDPGRLPEDDPATWRLLQAGDSLGVFQVESPGMRRLLRRLKPSSLEDLVALVALYRPGPLGAGMVDDFIDRKHGRQEVRYPHPWLEPILENTYGVVVYQEQVMKIAQVLANYSLGEADLLRRAMGKKKPEEMARQKERFLAGARENGVEPGVAESIFELLAQFAAYGFNKSHSAAYGWVAYQTAWLKANHRAEFMAALMSIEADDSDKLLTYVNDCRSAGIRVLPPSVNESGLRFEVRPEDRRAILFGLGAVKGVGESAARAILAAREEAGGRFADFMDCLVRIDHGRVNRRVLEQLVAAGAFDWTGHPRAALVEGLEVAIPQAQRHQADQASGQASLFGGPSGAPPVPTLRLPDIPEWPDLIRLRREREAVGFYLSGHPVEAFSGERDRWASARLSDLGRVEPGQAVSVAGVVTGLRRRRSRQGDRMGVLQLEDETGTAEVTFFPDQWASSRRALTSGEPVLVRGRVEAGEGTPRIRGESAETLPDLRARSIGSLVLDLQRADLDGGRIDALRELLSEAQGSLPVRIAVTWEGEGRVEFLLDEAYGAAPSPELEEAVGRLFRRPGVLRYVERR